MNGSKTRQLQSGTLDFLNTTLLESHHTRQQSQHSVAPSAGWVTLALGASSYLSVLAAKTFCRSTTSVSHLCSAGRQLLWGLHGFVSPDLVWFNGVPFAALTLVVFGLSPVGPGLALVFPSLSSRESTQFCFFQRCSFWTHGWGVSGLSIVLEHRLS